MAFELRPLPYAPEALEPYIDATTMQLHHAKHHQAYLDKLNKAIEGTDLKEKTIEDILKNVSNYSPIVRNNGGDIITTTYFGPCSHPMEVVNLQVL